MASPGHGGSYRSPGDAHVTMANGIEMPKIEKCVRKIYQEFCREQARSYRETT